MCVCLYSSNVVCVCVCVCVYVSGCKHVEELKLSRIKLSDQGLSLLLYYPLLSLRSLDLSHTSITNQALERLPLGKGYYTIIRWAGP